MHERIPEPLKALVEQLSRLPGLGPKSAMRAAMALLKWPEAETRRLGRGIHDLRDNLHLCSRCGGLSSSDPCAVCSDTERARDTLCLVTEWDSMLTLDEGGFYHGQYMILGGLIAPLERMDSDSLDMDRLVKRLAEGEVPKTRLRSFARWCAGSFLPCAYRALHRVFPLGPRSNIWIRKPCASLCSSVRIWPESPRHNSH